MKLVWPVKGKTTDEFDPGRGNVPGLGYLGAHTGLDIAAPPGVNITAAAPGVVTGVWFDRFTNGTPAGGHMVEVDHGHGIRTRYAHMLREASVRVGQLVDTSTILGLVGASGAATGSHLHFEVIVEGVFVDPRLYLDVVHLPVSDNPVKRKRNTMPIFIYVIVGGKVHYAIFDASKPGAGTWWQFTGQESANQLAGQYGPAMAVSKSTWDDRKKKFS